MSAKFTLTGAYSAAIERKLNEAAEMMAATLDQPADYRAWDQLLIYAPRDALERRLQTLGCEGDRHVSPLRPIRPDDEVRERTSQDRGFEPRTENAMAHEPCRNGDAGAQVLSGSVETVGADNAALHADSNGAHGDTTRGGTDRARIPDRTDVSPSDPAQEPEAVAWVQPDFARVLQRCGVMSAYGFDFKRDGDIPIYTRPVSLDREAVKRAIYNNVGSCADANFIDRRYLTGVDEAADVILALIEGRT